MCSISVVIGGSINELLRMYESTKRRGLRQFLSKYSNTNKKNIYVSFNHLPTTDNSFKNGFETDKSHVWLNGFISNYKELAEKYKLELTTDFDTEVVAKLIDKGINFSEFNGFFSIVWYCKQLKNISFITDRYGIKQMYQYTDSKGKIYISSELKGILSIFPNLEFDNEALEDWKYSLGVMTENTIYKGVKRIGKVDIPEIKRMTDTSPIAYETAKIFLSDLLKKSLIRNKYNGPDGVYLSGGIDSGILAEMINPDYTFSVDYVDPKFSEIDLIKKNSKGNHFTFIMNNETIKKYSEKTLFALDDLKAGSCYTNFAISEFASKYVCVVYSGAGGDEFFGGYPHRLNKSVIEVIRRNDKIPLKHYDISHFEYDLNFLQAVLIVEDRMSGYHTMETRYPLLDNDLVNYALSLPLEFLENKRILKDISNLSDEVLNGKKKGFSNPGFTNEEWVNYTLENLKK